LGDVDPDAVDVAAIEFTERPELTALFCYNDLGA
jgi:hypothetical protein